MTGMSQSIYSKIQACKKAPGPGWPGRFFAHDWQDITMDVQPVKQHQKW
jgi:hypothetical protein